MKALMVPVSTVIEFPDGSRVEKPMIGKYFMAISDYLLGQMVEKQNDGMRWEYMVLISQSTALEALLNDEILIACMPVFGRDQYKSHARELLRASTRGKLTLLPPLVTNNEFVLNQSSPEVHQLLAMTKKRNDIVHSKSEFEPYIDDLRTVTGSGAQRPNKDLPPALSVSIGELKTNSNALSVFFSDFVIAITEANIAPNRMLERAR